MANTLLTPRMIGKTFTTMLPLDTPVFVSDELWELNRDMVVSFTICEKKTRILVSLSDRQMSVDSFVEKFKPQVTEAMIDSLTFYGEPRACLAATQEEGGK